MKEWKENRAEHRVDGEAPNLLELTQGARKLESVDFRFRHIIGDPLDRLVTLPEDQIRLGAGGQVPCVGIFPGLYRRQDRSAEGQAVDRLAQRDPVTGCPHGKGRGVDAMPEMSRRRSAIDVQIAIDRPLQVEPVNGKLDGVRIGEGGVDVQLLVDPAEKAAGLGVLPRIDAFRALHERLEHIDGGGQLALVDQRLSILTPDLRIILTREEQRFGHFLHLPEVGLAPQEVQDPPPRSVSQHRASMQLHNQFVAQSRRAVSIEAVDRVLQLLEELALIPAHHRPPQSASSSRSAVRSFGPCMYLAMS